MPEESFPEAGSDVLATLVEILHGSGNIDLSNTFTDGDAEFILIDYDNWNGGTYSWSLKIEIPVLYYAKIFEDLQDIANECLRALAYLDRLYPNHRLNGIEIIPSPQRAISSERSPIAPNALDRIWGKGAIRIFLSHKSQFKAETAQLQKALLKYGISSFVAHEDIHPTEEWMKEIEKALFSMDALVALLNKDFSDSDWTDQEVGVAIGRQVPLIAIRLGSDPYGLMGKWQGVGGCSWEEPDGMAKAITDLLHKKLADKSKSFEAAISAYSASTSYEISIWTVENLLSKFKVLSPDQVNKVLEAFRNNSQNYKSYAGRNHLISLLKKWTGEGWTTKDNTLVKESSVNTTSNDIPF